MKKNNAAVSFLNVPLHVSGDDYIFYRMIQSEEVKHRPPFSKILKAAAAFLLFVQRLLGPTTDTFILCIVLLFKL